MPIIIKNIFAAASRPSTYLVPKIAIFIALKAAPKVIFIATSKVI